MALSTTTTKHDPGNTEDQTAISLTGLDSGSRYVLEVCGVNSTTSAPAAPDAPSGWSLVGEHQMAASATPFVWIYQSEPSPSATAAWSWAEAVNLCYYVTECTGAATSGDLVPATSLTFHQRSGGTTIDHASGTTADRGLLHYGFINKTGSSAYGSMTDTDRGSSQHSGSATSALRREDTVQDSGYVYDKTGTGASSSIGFGWAFVIVPADDEPTEITATLSGLGTLTADWHRGVDDWIADRPMYVAHRGGSADWPEMTMYAYAQAVAWHPGVGLNMDVVPTSDGVWVGSHDLTTGRVFGAENNYTIASTAWSTLSTLRTTVGSQPMARLDDFLDTYGGNPAQPVFLDNKQGDVVQADLLDWLTTNYPGWQDWIVFKGYRTAVASLQAAKDAGARTWEYLYGDDLDADTAGDDVAHPTEADLSAATMFGLNYDADSSAWSTLLGYGRPVLAHIVDTATHKGDADTNSGGLLAGYMASGVTEVIPQTHADLTATLAGAGTLTAVLAPAIAAAAALTGAGTLAASLTPALDTVATLTGTGTLAAALTPAIATDSALAAVGTLTAALAPAIDSGSDLAAAGTLAASMTPAIATTAALSAVGTLTAVLTREGETPAMLTGTGTLTATFAPAIETGSSLAAAGTLTAALTPAIAAAAGLSALGTLTAEWADAPTTVRQITATASLTADTRTGALVAAARRAALTE